MWRYKTIIIIFIDYKKQCTFSEFESLNVEMKTNVNRESAHFYEG